LVHSHTTYAVPIHTAVSLLLTIPCLPTTTCCLWLLFTLHLPPTRGVDGVIVPLPVGLRCAGSRITYRRGCSSYHVPSACRARIHTHTACCMPSRLRGRFSLDRHAFALFFLTFATTAFALFKDIRTGVVVNMRRLVVSSATASLPQAKLVCRAPGVPVSLLVPQRRAGACGWLPVPPATPYLPP